MKTYGVHCNIFKKAQVVRIQPFVILLHTGITTYTLPYLMAVFTYQYERTLFNIKLDTGKNNG